MLINGLIEFQHLYFQSENKIWHEIDVGGVFKGGTLEARFR